MIEEKEDKKDLKPQDLSCSIVTTKYRDASVIANNAILKIINIIKKNVEKKNKEENEEEKEKKNKKEEEEKNEEQKEKKEEKNEEQKEKKEGKKKEKKKEKKNNEEKKNDEEIKDELDIAYLCNLSDNYIIEETSKIYNKKEKGEKIEKGVAFPTCISTNEICAHFCPLKDESYSLKPGDLVKIALGVHIDGYICVVGHTLIVSEDEEEMKNREEEKKEEKEEEEKKEEKEKEEEEEKERKEKEKQRKNDVLKAAWYAGEVALKLIKPGNKSNAVTAAIQKTVKQFNCSPVHGFCSHQMKRYVIDGNQRIANSDNPEDKVEEFVFQLYEVYGVDILVSTGEGKARDSGKRIMVFKRAVETNYNLKTHLARNFFYDVNKRYPTLPFTVRNMEDERAWKIGVMECLRHELIHPYAVITEKPGEYVAQIKFTVLVLPGGTKKITGFPFEIENAKSNYEIVDSEIKKILQISAGSKKKKKNKSHATNVEEEADEHENTTD